jgi:hypothetical protein
MEKHMKPIVICNGPVPFNAVLAVCFAILGAVGIFWGVHVRGSSDSYEYDSYFIWSVGFLFFSGVMAFSPRQKFGFANISSALLLLGYAIDKWLRAKSLHVLAILFLLASACFAANAVHERQNKKRLAINETASTEN